MIISFADRETSDIYHGVKSPKARKTLDPILWKVAHRKLDMLNRAKKIEDLRIPPSNKLEKLTGDLVGKYSIRINDQWRIIFRWEPDSAGASEVKIVDYH
ncbi:MAG: type II toxin-antitoxin system RelE/ParE family toxin [Simkania negevensis]|nr:type II toxin-antitoxin system RelE/ParE family toxin [Simkania negevensis]